MGKREDRYREIRDGVWFYFSAMGGVFFAVGCCVPAVGNGFDEEWIFVSRTIAGAIAGGTLWLVWKYTRAKDC